MKRSLSVPLIVLGTLSLSSCGQREPLMQQVYSSKEECEQDWTDGESCNTAAETNYEHHRLWYGPRYYWDRGLGRPVALRPDGSTRIVNNTRISQSGSTHGYTQSSGSIKRGGFGSVMRSGGG